MTDITDIHGNEVVMAQVQAGWYPDPSGDPNQLRWWDGNQWTDATMPAPSAPPQQQQQSAYQQPQYGAYGYAPQPTYTADGTYFMTETDRNLRLAAFVLNVIGCVAWCWTLIALAWMIPMTIHNWRIYKGEAANTTAFGVCTLIFANQIAGILLLVSRKDA